MTAAGPPRAHGTRYELAGGRLARIVDAGGAVHAELAWDGDALEALVVPGAIVRGAVLDDPLLGPAHAIAPRAPSGEVGAPVTACSAIAWARPTEIPAIADPARLPAGAAPALMNALAVLAALAEVPALHYAGPYPTSALYRALARSFATDATEDAFTADALGRALRRDRAPLPFAFRPAPHERRAHARGHSELRGGLERAIVDGLAYARGAGVARLVDDGAGGARAEVWFADAPYAVVATLGPDGALVGAPAPLPACASPVLGQAFPAPLRDALGELVAELVPAPLAPDARAALAGATVRWADLGARAAAATPEGFAVHAALWDRLAPGGLARVALALAEALAPVVAGAVVASITAAGARRATVE